MRRKSLKFICITLLVSMVGMAVLDAKAIHLMQLKMEKPLKNK